MVRARSRVRPPAVAPKKQIMTALFDLIVISFIMPYMSSMVTKIILCIGICSYVILGVYPIRVNIMTSDHNSVMAEHESVTGSASRTMDSNCLLTHCLGAAINTASKTAAFIFMLFALAVAVSSAFIGVRTVMSISSPPQTWFQPLYLFNTIQLFE